MTSSAKSAASRHNLLRAQEWWRQRRRENIATYAANPKRCGFCAVALSYDERDQAYCGHSCAARAHANPKPPKLSRAERLARHLRETPFDRLGEAHKRVVIRTEQGGRCGGCDLAEWRDRPITLELEHKDGDRSNWARENLVFLCPNCHSLTPTWRGRNKTGNGIPIRTPHGSSLRQVLLARGLTPKGSNYRTLKKMLGLS